MVNTRLETSVEVTDAHNPNPTSIPPNGEPHVRRISGLWASRTIQIMTAEADFMICMLW